MIKNIDDIEINGINYVMWKLNTIGFYPQTKKKKIALKNYIDEFGTVFIYKNKSNEIIINWSLSQNCIGEIEKQIDGSYFVREYSNDNYKDIKYETEKLPF